MKTKILSIPLLAIALLASCTSHQYVAYTLKNSDHKGQVNQDEFKVDYSNFTLYYNAEGGCTLRNNSDQMMIVDMGTSYYLTDDGTSHTIYDSKVTSVTDTRGHSAGIGSGYWRGYYPSSLGVGITATNTTSTTTVEKEDRYIFIPPHASSNLKFYSLQAPSPYMPGSKKFVQGEKIYDTTGANSFLPCAHVMSYAFGQANDTVASKYQMTRNEFYPTWQVVSKKATNYVGRNVQHNEVSDETQNTWAAIGAVAGTVALIAIVVALCLRP